MNYDEREASVYIFSKAKQEKHYLPKEPVDVLLTNLPIVLISLYKFLHQYVVDSSNMGRYLAIHLS